MEGFEIMSSTKYFHNSIYLRLRHQSQKNKRKIKKGMAIKRRPQILKFCSTKVGIVNELFIFYFKLNVLRTTFRRQS